MQTIVDDYHNTLKELVGEGGYEEFLNSLHFVFTHNDETYDGETYTSEQISMRCEELTFYLFAKEVKNLFLPQFVMRMGEAHTLVDYSTQTSEELRQSIESSSAVPADAVMTVNIDTNDLNRQCARFLAAKQQALEIKNRERSDDWGKAVTKVLKHKELLETACDGANAALAKFEQDWSDARIDPHVVSTANPAQTNEISLISAVARIFEQNDLATDLQRDVAKYAELSNTMHDAILKAREELHSASCIVPEGVPGQPMPEPEPEPSGRWM
eukprot:COSAG02_NODE_12102_length_1595_cov_6.282086_2_plen_271_part_00